MPRMKHLLRKLHIGGETRPVLNSDPSPPSTSSSSSSAAAMAAERPATTTLGISPENSTTSSTTAATADDFNFMEEEFQVQLALAISVSDPNPKREDTESVQIKAAKRMSLGYSPSSVAVEEAETPVEFLSLRYWNYNFVNYDEKIMDGFYDVYEIASDSISQGKMPLLAELLAISVMDKVEYEVVLVNRTIDHELQQLEERAYQISLECQFSEKNILVQKIADLVVNRMGGAVGDADEMWKRWAFRSYEIRNSHNTVVLPLGCLDIGLSRHRALLFKVLADRINFPCMLVKGTYYTGTDEGAVNLIKFDDGSEYIIDLMGAPGTLIPPETPCSLPNSEVDKRFCANAMETLDDSTLILDKGTIEPNITPDVSNSNNITSLMSSEASFSSIQIEEKNRNISKKRETEKFEHEFGKLLPVLPQLHEMSPGPSEKASSAQKIKVKDVSKYVISAAKNPEFAQKLHAVLLESGAAPPADLFSNIIFQDEGKQNIIDEDNAVEGRKEDEGAYSHLDKLLLPSTSTGMLTLNKTGYDTKQKWSAEEPVEEPNILKRNKNDPKSLVSHSDISEEFVMVSSGSNESTQTDGACVMVSTNSSKMATGASNVDQIYESSLPFAADPCEREPGKALIADDQLFFQHKVDKTLNNTETGKLSVTSMIETSMNNLRITGNGHNEMINPLLGEVAEWEILWEDLQIGERIGIGSYGEVYHADWNGTEVAVKKFLVQDFSGDTLDQFKCEIEIMLRLRHPNVVLFMGAVARPPNLSILTEFIPRGSLYKLLHRPNHHINEKRRLKMALDVAKGMNYLHTSHPTIVHRDLKSPNLLVDKNWVVKVCDFGLSRLKHHTFLSSKSTAGTPEWMAPEVLRNERSNEKCDIYSFGVILWELATSRVPWSGLNPMQVVGAVGFQNRRLDIPEDVDPVVAQIIRDCWENDPQLRPTFSQLILRLRRAARLCFQSTDTTSQITK